MEKVIISGKEYQLDVAWESNSAPRFDYSTKGCESANFILAVSMLALYQLDYVEIQHPEWEGQELKICVG